MVNVSVARKFEQLFLVYPVLVVVLRIEVGLEQGFGWVMEGVVLARVFVFLVFGIGRGA